MKRPVKRKSMMIIGALLLVLAAGLLLYTIHSERSSEQLSGALISEYDRIVSGTNAPLDSFSGEMPVLNIDGKDIVGKLAFPTFGISSPVLCEENGAILRRISGSLYDGDLVLEGSSKQMIEAAKSIANDELIEYTDAQGNIFLLEADKITHTSDPESVDRESAVLTIIVKNDLDMSCIVISCSEK